MSQMPFWPPLQPKKPSGIYYKKPDWDIQVGDLILIHCEVGKPHSTGPLQAQVNGSWLRVMQIRKKTRSYQCSYSAKDNGVEIVRRTELMYFIPVFLWTTNYITQVYRKGILIYSESPFEPQQKTVSLPEI